MPRNVVFGFLLFSNEWKVLRTSGFGDFICGGAAGTSALRRCGFSKFTILIVGCLIF